MTDPAGPPGLEGEGVDLVALLEAYVGRVEALWAENVREVRAALDAERQSRVLLEARVQDLESLTARLSGALEEIRRSTFFRSALPQSLRPSLEERESDTLSRALRGESPPDIAAAQRRPVGEVELVLRLASRRRALGALPACGLESDRMGDGGQETPSSREGRSGDRENRENREDREDRDRARVQDGVGVGARAFASRAREGETRSLGGVGEAPNAGPGRGDARNTQERGRSVKAGPALAGYGERPQRQEGTSEPGALSKRPMAAKASSHGGQEAAGIRLTRSPAEPARRASPAEHTTGPL